ncbi:MAG TPA: efflux RND transporter permease subunit [Candidatus Omnitrophica bacterium]|nr:efflux RND transporter permease subunit [Candidatus Omnitrophota bacterium]
MILPRIAIYRPVTMLMVFSGIVLIGYIALVQLPVELMPNYSYETISIIIRVRGGIPSPDVERLVTKPVEEAVSDVSNLKELISISEEGESRVILRFEPGTNMDFASLEVREKFGRVKDKLPKEIEKPVIARYQQTDVPIVILAVTGEKYTPEMLRRMIDEKVKSRLQRVEGVANVEVVGGRERKILVEPKEDVLRAYNISLGQIIQTVGANNLDLLVGEMEEDKLEYLLRILGQFREVEDIRELGVAVSPQGSIIKLKEIADVKDSFLEPIDLARVDARPVVSIYIQKESTANTIKVDAAVMEEVEKIKKEVLPPDVIIKPTFQQAEYVQEAIDTVRKSLILGGALAVIVLLIFLQDVPPTFIIALSIPLSVMLTFVLMFIQKLTLNVMTLSGLALGIGMLVDSSIVVLENVFKKKEQGYKKKEAALEGSQEVSLAITASTLTSVVAFLPIVFVGKQMRILYSGLAWTVVYSLLASLFVALTLVPLASSRIEMGKRKVVRGNRNKFEKVKYIYRKMLAIFIRYRYTLVLSLFGIFIYILPLHKKIGREFIGITEQNKFTIHVELPTGARLEMSDQCVGMVENVVRKLPEVRTVSSRIERWSSKVYVKLKPLSQRRRSTHEIISSLRPIMNEIEKYFDAFIYFELPQEVGSQEIFIDIYGYDYDVLKQIAIGMAQKLTAVKGLTDQKIRMREGRPEIRVLVDRDKASTYGLTMEDIAYQLHGKIRGLRASYYHTESKEVEIVVRLPKESRDTFTKLKNLTLVNKEGIQIPLNQIADLKFDIAPSEIWHKNKSRMVQVSANRGVLDLKKAVELSKQALKDFQMPKNYTFRFSGDYELMIENARQLNFALIVAVFLIFLVLGSLFESYMQPFIIMTTVPLAAIGVIPALYYTHTSINMGALMGMLMLGGIVVNNAIVMVDHINQLRSRMDLRKAVIMGAGDRIRPIMMTSLTTICSLVPMALDKSESSNLWSPLAKTVISGLSVSTFLTLVVIPSVYVIIEDIRVMVIAVWKGFFKPRYSKGLSNG